MQPAARCIAILREPASFVRSLHLQLVQEHVETEKDLRASAQSSSDARIDPRRPRRVLRYSDHVHYVEQLRRFHASFPREQVLVLIYDDFRRDNEATVRRVLRFLDVDDTCRSRRSHANPTRGRALAAARRGDQQAVRRGRPGVRAPQGTLSGRSRPSACARRAMSTLRRRVVYARSGARR